MTQKELFVKNFKAALPYFNSLSYKHRYFYDLYHALTGKDIGKQMTIELKDSITKEVSELIDRVEKMGKAEFDTYDRNTPIGRLSTMAFHKIPKNPLPPFPVGIAIISAHFLYGDMALVVVCEEKDEFGTEAVLVDKVLELVNGQWVDGGEYDTPHTTC